MTTVTVTGRNGSEYDAQHLAGNMHIVGKFIVEVLNGRCVRTACKATKANVKMYAR